MLDSPATRTRTVLRHRPAGSAGLRGQRVRRLDELDHRDGRTARAPGSPSSRGRSRTPRTGPSSARPCCGRARPIARTIEWRFEADPCRRDAWSNASWAGQGRTVSAGRVWAPGSWAPTGATSPRPTPGRCSRPPPRRASPSTTPPTSTATAAASRSWVRFLADHADDGFTVATKMGRRVDQVPENYNPDELPRLDRPVAPQPRCRPARPGPAALPAVGHDRRRRDLRRARRAGRGRLHRGVRRQRGDRRPGAQRDDPTAPRDRADHPERAAAQAAREGAADRDRDRGRHHRAGAAGLGPALGEVRREHHLRRTTTTAPTTGTAAPSTSARPSPACPFDVGLEAAADFTSPGRASRRPDGLTAAQAAIAWVVAAARCQHRDPGRTQRAAGAVQRGRRRGARAGRGVPRRGGPDLRRAGPRAGARPLVSRRRRSGSGPGPRPAPDAPPRASERRRPSRRGRGCPSSARPRSSAQRAQRSTAISWSSWRGSESAR